MTRTQTTRILTTLALALGLAAMAGGCDKNCEKLRAKVCDDERFSKQYKKQCELLQEADRYESLSGDTCKGILTQISDR
jgi:hypothetical protein